VWQPIWPCRRGSIASDFQLLPAVPQHTPQTKQLCPCAVSFGFMARLEPPEQNTVVERLAQLRRVSRVLAR
jgi:hypothetical protein